MAMMVPAVCRACGREYSVLMSSPAMWALVNLECDCGSQVTPLTLWFPVAFVDREARWGC